MTRGRCTNQSAQYRYHQLPDFALSTVTGQLQGGPNKPNQYSNRYTVRLARIAVRTNLALWHRLPNSNGVRASMIFERH